MEEEIEKIEKVENNLIQWEKSEAEKLLRIVNSALDLDNHKIKLPGLKDEITFFEFEDNYKKSIDFGRNALATEDDDFIKVIDDIKVNLRTIVKERLNDGIRKLLEIIKQFEINNNNLNKNLNQYKFEVEKMTKDIEAGEQAKFENKKFKNYAVELQKKITLLVTNFEEDFKKTMERINSEYNIESEEKNKLKMESDK